MSHECCASHVDNAIKLGLLGTMNVASQLDGAYRCAIEQHNQQTEENRYVLGRIITCIELCGECEIALRGHDKTADSLNSGIFRCMFEKMCERDSRLKSHYDAQTYFKGTSAIIQNNFWVAYAMFTKLLSSWQMHLLLPCRKMRQTLCPASHK